MIRSCKTRIWTSSILGVMYWRLHRSVNPCKSDRANFVPSFKGCWGVASRVRGNWEKPYVYAIEIIRYSMPFSFLVEFQCKRGTADIIQLVLRCDCDRDVAHGFRSPWYWECQRCGVIIMLFRALTCWPWVQWEENIMASTAVDVKELATSYIFVADMPGLKHTDIKVDFPHICPTSECFTGSCCRASVPNTAHVFETSTSISSLLIEDQQFSQVWNQILRSWIGESFVTDYFRARMHGIRLFIWQQKIDHTAYIFYPQSVNAK